MAKVLPLERQYQQVPVVGEEEISKESAVDECGQQPFIAESPKIEPSSRLQITKIHERDPNHSPTLTEANPAAKEKRFWQTFLDKLDCAVEGPSGRGIVASTDISSYYSVSTALVAIIQLVFASLTIYHAHGDQILRYGHAAFGHTVAPYLVMSTVNLFGSLLTPN
ncbi:hypothetical protein Vi05172_g334 [Venturia inaequalis]|uniref:Uncharacterized protein n=1 Tax=Venturia inaequalis TaxID=5025 RepID=A0A8H3UCM6_VENIN|nr:hypothetical protein EG327_011343 [Venturia inaequalis]RDI89209.1 hypothetical protein Vi05172_g334 [Venturia inaequalis]